LSFSKKRDNPSAMTSYLEHHYGSQVHIVESPACAGVLADLCAPTTFQPRINDLVRYLYDYLLGIVIDAEFPSIAFQQATRMTEQPSSILLTGRRIDPHQRTVVVDVARAGIIPSQLSFEKLHFHLRPENLRLDHIFASRKIDSNHHVIGTDLGAAKIGGPVKDSIMLLPDPMGATGETVISILNHYKSEIPGPAKKWILLHLIVTPEYLKNVTIHHPDALIYALRLDRGLSSSEVLKTTPGALWREEKGLNKFDYIVPGGGGFGEIINNSFI